MSFTFLYPRRLSSAAAVLLLLAASIPRTAAAQAVYHILEKGETLYSVARSYGVSPDTIVKANSIDHPSKLRAGKRLLIPGGVATHDVAASGEDAHDPAAVESQKYKVVKGDTLFSIARACGVSLNALRAANKLTASAVIKAGDTLAIPAGGKFPPALPAATANNASTPVTVSVSTPAVPEAVKTSVKPVSKGLSWPCPGEILYLDGKAYGVVIRAKLGEALKAVASGTVSSAGPYRGYGNVVFVLARGYIYVYGGNDSISVRAGDQVVAGQELGRVGMDVKQGGPAAYFLVFKNGEAVDPAAAPRG
jgi:murein DD-endopeptidase MepM/ murein hydrolase activator NlpD